MTPKLVPARLGPSAIGMLVSVSIVGLALFPWVAGVLAQAVGIWTLLPYALVLTVSMLAVWYLLSVILQRGAHDQPDVLVAENDLLRKNMEN
jgi:fucose permease